MDIWLYTIAKIWNYKIPLTGETDIENRLMDMGRGEERVRCMKRVTWKLTLPYGWEDPLEKEMATHLSILA